MQLHLFGSSTTSGASFKRLLSVLNDEFSLVSYSRSNSSFPADLNCPDAFYPDGVPGESGLWISFAPIWLFAPFIEQLAREYPERLNGLSGVIACSSSSAVTKRFASNSYDRDLVARLITAEDSLISTCRFLNVPCRILRPTIIYGRVGPYVDSNLSRLIGVMRRLPFLPIPAVTGLRQPIHASQLAAVTLEIVRQLCSTSCDLHLSERIELGGDQELNYAAMLTSLQQSLPSNDPARSCLLLPLPPRIFYTLAAPLLLCSPKLYEAVLRIGSNLSGFQPAHHFLNSKPQSFPILPLL